MSSRQATLVTTAAHQETAGPVTAVQTAVSDLVELGSSRPHAIGMASFPSYSPFRAAQPTCPKCNWQGQGRETDVGELFAGAPVAGLVRVERRTRARSSIMAACEVVPMQRTS